MAAYLLSGRVAAIILGIASVILGGLALLWPDITVFVIAVVFGIRLVVTGIALLLAAVGPARVETGGAVMPERPGLVRRFMRTAGAIVALLIALALVGVSSQLHAGEPVPNGFYTFSGEVPSAPGRLLRSEPFARDVPAGARAWRILYTTTRDEGVPALASGLVVAPVETTHTPHPVIAWAHGTTGVDVSCAPSLLASPFTAGATPALDRVISNGWALVATDYIGLGTQGPHPYLVGQPSGRAVLDAVRAARQLPDLPLADQTIVWGHSQGGGAALWTGIVAPAYAPEVPLAGVAALAPASELPAFFDTLATLSVGSVFASYVVSGYTGTYPDLRLDDLIRPAARIIVQEIAARCLAEPESFVSIVSSLLIDSSIFSGDPARGPLAQRLAENVPRGPIPAPVLLGQGLADALISQTAQDTYVAARCAAGYAVDYRTYPGLGHVEVVGSDSSSVADLLAWTEDRLEGAPPASTCP
jgi:alpha-beta hydrolase superfamily lysophospholipase